MERHFPVPSIVATRCRAIAFLAVVPLFGGCASRPTAERAPAACDGERVVRVRNASGVLADIFSWQYGRPRESSYIGSVSPGRTGEFTIPDNVWVSARDPALARDEPQPAPPGVTIRFEYFCR